MSQPTPDPRRGVAPFESINPGGNKSTSAGGAASSTNLDRLGTTTSSQSQAGGTADPTSRPSVSRPADTSSGGNVAPPPGNFVITFKDEPDAVEPRAYGDFVVPANPQDRTRGIWTHSGHEIKGYWNYPSLLCPHGRIDPATLGTSSALLTMGELVRHPGHPGAGDDNNLCTTCAMEDFSRCELLVEEVERLAEDDGVMSFGLAEDVVE